MKKLQNSFTTLEQSKRLLELGVPDNSADCYYHHEFTNERYPILRVLQLQWNETIGAIRGKTGQKIDPCWSVGRLIEIFEICTGLVWPNEVIDGYTKIDMLLEDFEDRENKYHFDFSKLEE